ncbi:MAG: hypothetical protein ABL874_04065 [Sphingopyxis sp.]
MLRYALPFTLLPLLASCAAPQVPPPAATPAPPATPRATPAPAAVVDRHAGDWSVGELTPGEWRISRGLVNLNTSFRNARGEEIAQISCDGGNIGLRRSGAVPADATVSMRVRTSFAQRDLSVRVDHAVPLIYTSLDARDPLWDQIATSRGRFLIEVSHQSPLILPVRPEIARVIEDCRG